MTLFLDCVIQLNGLIAPFSIPLDGYGDADLPWPALRDKGRRFRNTLMAGKQLHD
jgi:hypothetical protein